MQRNIRTRTHLAVISGLVVLFGCAAQQQRYDAADGASLGAVAGEMPFDSAAGEAGYHMLMAEIARSRGEWAVSASEYRKAAELSDDPATAERAARVAFDHGAWAEARAAARRWYELDPDAPGSRNLLTTLEVRLGNEAQARTLLLEVLAQAEREGWLADGLALAAALLDAQGAWDLSRTLMHDIARQYRDYPAAHLNLAMLYLRADRADGAVAPAREALRLAPGSLRAHAVLATALLETGDLRAAVDVVAAGAQLPTAGAEYRLRHAMILAAAGREDEARQLLEALLSARPRMTAALRQAGLLAQRAGRLDEARDYFRRMLRAGDRTTALYLLGRTEDLAGNPSGALRLFREVTDGEYVVLAQVRRAELLADAGRGEDALALLAHYAASHPEHDIDFTQARAALLARLGRTEDALAGYDEAIARWPGDPSLRYARAFLLLDAGRVEGALVDLEYLATTYPDDATALNAYGYTLADHTTRFREARRYLERALALEPDNGAIVDSLGWLAYRRGRLRRATAYLRRAFELLPDPEIAAHLGEVLWMSGRPEEAHQVWRDALARFPDSAALRAVMARFAD